MDHDRRTGGSFCQGLGVEKVNAHPFDGRFGWMRSVAAGQPQGKRGGNLTWPRLAQYAPAGSRKGVGGAEAKAATGSEYQNGVVGLHAVSCCGRYMHCENFRPFTQLHICLHQLCNFE